MFFLKKLIYSVLVVLGVVSLIFVLFNVVPGDPARMVLGQRADSVSLAAAKKDLGLDLPLVVQYLKYINDLSPLSFHQITNEKHPFYYDTLIYTSSLVLFKFMDYSLVLKLPYLRRSYQTRENVSDILFDALPNTIILAFFSILFAFLAGVFLGILCSLNQNTILDRMLLAIASLGVSLPSFFAAIIIGWFFAYQFSDFTGLNLTGNLVELDDLGNRYVWHWKNIILPTLTLGIRPLSIAIQLTRNSMIDVLGQDYIRTAKAYGASTFVIVWRHALRNALNPVVTSLSGWFASMMAGVVFVEYIFGWKGLGYVIVSALNNFDVPLVMGAVILISLIFVVVNLLTDFIYRWLDPRVR